MKASILTHLFALLTLTNAASTLSASPIDLPTQTADILPRQNLGQVPITTAVTQAPIVMTYYIATPVGTTDAEVPMTYTQLFSKFPGQLPSPGVGSIGYGTLSSTPQNSKPKRTAAPMEENKQAGELFVETGIAGRIRMALPAPTLPARRQ